jgi:hypothetical protein
MAPQHASCDIAQQLGSTPVYFLLSSTPDRAARLPRILATMRRQSLQPAAIVLSIASTYNTTRFVNSSYTIAPELLNQRPRLLVHTVPRDLGPITKSAGVNYLLAHLQPASLARQAIVVVGDDDMFYGSSFIEDYACAVASGPENAVYSVNGRAASNMQKEQRATALDPNLVLRHCFADGSLDVTFDSRPCSTVWNRSRLPGATALVVRHGLSRHWTARWDARGAWRPARAVRVLPRR